MQRKAFLHAALGAAALALGAAPAGAQPDAASRPVRIVVTFPPGGSTDVAVRILAPALGERLGQQVIVDNRPGAGGNIGLAMVARAAPDGQTLGVGAAGALSANASLYAQMPFDVARDFRAVAMLAGIPFVVVAHPGAGVRSLGEVVTQARAQPGRWTIAHGGNGTAMHLTSQLLQQTADVRFSDVPYKGTGPATLDVLSGQVALGVVDLPAALAHVRAGKLVALAVTSAQRLPQLPAVPTVAESGWPGYDSTGWFGVVAPAGTPEPIVERLATEFAAVLADPAIVALLRAQGIEPAPRGPAAFAAYIRSETAKWSAVVRRGGIKLD